MFGSCSSNDITERVEALADRACACKDADCARVVLQELITLGKENRNSTGDKKRGEKAGSRLAECVVEAGLPLDEVMAMGKELSEL